MSSVVKKVADKIAGVGTEKENIRIDAICSYLEKHGPSSRKKISRNFGYKSNWCTKYLKMGILQKRIVKTTVMRPERFDVVRDLAERRRRIRGIPPKEIVFTIEVGIMVEGKMQINIDEPLELLRQYGRAEVIDATVREVSE